jgi:hypothetical protein
MSVLPAELHKKRQSSQPLKIEFLRFLIMWGGLSANNVHGRDGCVRVADLGNRLLASGNGGTDLISVCCDGEHVRPQATPFDRWRRQVGWGTRLPHASPPPNPAVATVITVPAAIFGAKTFRPRPPGWRVRLPCAAT